MRARKSTVSYRNGGSRQNLRAASPVAVVVYYLSDRRSGYFQDFERGVWGVNRPLGISSLCVESWSIDSLRCGPNPAGFRGCKNITAVDRPLLQTGVASKRLNVGSRNQRARHTVAHGQGLWFCGAKNFGETPMRSTPSSQLQQWRYHRWVPGGLAP